MSKKFKLQIDDFDYLPELVLGIHSHSKDYKLVWGINKTCHLSLKKDEPVVAKLSGSAHSRHSHFSSEFDIQLIKNKSDGDYFLPEDKNPDFILVMSEAALDEDELITQLNEVKEILLVKTIDLTNFKSKVNFEDLL